MRIGVTSADDPSPDNYVAALERAGAVAVILPSDLTRLDAMLADVNGILVTGGTDVDPARYDQKPSQHSDAPDHVRDGFELAVVNRATELGLPLLMICRGMQIANIAFGGSLHQHIPDITDGKVVHKDMNRKFETFPEHYVTVVPQSMLASITGEHRFMTNASHHQAISRIGEGLRAVAFTDDGIIEALEYPAARAFWLGVQWHPERLLDADGGRSSAIFSTFLRAASPIAPVGR